MHMCNLNAVIDLDDSPMYSTDCGGMSEEESLTLFTVIYFSRDTCKYVGCVPSLLEEMKSERGGSVTACQVQGVVPSLARQCHR
mmetsp:Transcript_32356/g.95337  ORF Transcript_32356/g.95337 Transcript_32356/m.95337 type:complete len:84 (-) Transcript_32356:665-916(-)